MSKKGSESEWKRVCLQRPTTRMTPLPSMKPGIGLTKTTGITPARIARTSDQLSEQENMEEIERAINDIIKYDPLGIYKKVKRKLKPEPAVTM